MCEVAVAGINNVGWNILYSYIDKTVSFVILVLSIYLLSCEGQNKFA